MARPNWAYWNNLAEVEWHEAVELSCNVAPGSLEDGSDFVPAGVNELTREIATRRLVVLSHIAARTLDVAHRGENRLVRLRVFRAWAESLPTPFTFPAEFPQAVVEAAADVRASRVESDKSLDTRERTTLLCIIGALAREARLDLSEPYKAGEAVAKMLPDGVEISPRTIGGHLKGVSDAMDSRKT